MFLHVGWGGVNMDAQKATDIAWRFGRVILICAQGASEVIAKFGPVPAPSQKRLGEMFILEIKPSWMRLRH